MVGVAVGMVGIIVFTGHSQPAPRVTAAATTPLGLNPDRLREYQDRLRALDERARLQAKTDPSPVAARRRRRNRTSERLARSIRWTRSGNVGSTTACLPATWCSAADRPVNSRSAIADTATRSAPPTAAREASAPTPPNLDDVAAAVVRASARYGPATSPGQPPGSGAAPAPPASMPAVSSIGGRRTPPSTDPISPAGPVHRLLEGTVIDTVLTNRLDGAHAAPVNCLVTNPVYSQSGQQVRDSCRIAGVRRDETGAKRRRVTVGRRLPSAHPAGWPHGQSRSVRGPESAR